MSILIKGLILLCAVHIFSYFKWCLKHDKSNIIGNISVFILGVGLIAAVVLIYTRVN